MGQQVPAVPHLFPRIGIHGANARMWRTTPTTVGVAGLSAPMARLVLTANVLDTDSALRHCAGSRMRKSLAIAGSIVAVGFLVAVIALLIVALTPKNPLAEFDICFEQDFPGAGDRYTAYTPVRCSNPAARLGEPIGANYGVLRFEDVDGDGNGRPTQLPGRSGNRWALRGQSLYRCGEECRADARENG